MDIGGCVNVLVPGQLMGPMVPGMAPNSTLLDVKKYEGPLPNGQGFEAKLDAIAKTESCREIIEGHGFEAIQASVRARLSKEA